MLNILSQVEIGGRPNAVEFIDDDVFCVAGEVRTELGWLKGGPQVW